MADLCMSNVVPVATLHHLCLRWVAGWRSCRTEGVCDREMPHAFWKEIYRRDGASMQVRTCGGNYTCL